jgi:hypothetical protein
MSETPHPPSLPLTGESNLPDWSRARALADGIKHHFRLSLAGQILLGHELQTLKIELNFCGSGRRAEERSHDGTFKSLNRTWDQWTKSELGIGHAAADRLIECYEAAKSKLKKLGGQPRLVSLLDSKPAALSEESRNILSAMVDKLEWGDSQKALLEEFRLVKRHEALTGGDTSKHRKPSKDEAIQQMAFAFFSKVPMSLGKMDRTIGNLRVAPDYELFLHRLPLVSSNPGELSIGSLTAEVIAAERELAALKADLDQAARNIGGDQPARLSLPAPLPA